MFEQGRASGLDEADYTAFYDRIATSPGGLAFLREHARRAGEAGQGEMARALADLRRLFREQADTLMAAGRAEALRRELLEMAASIEQARREVAALRPKDAGSNRLEIASNELDAIVSTTERASFDILQSAERLMDIGNRLREAGGRDELCDAIEAEVMSIFTACSFQDLTGQRTSKVVNALRYVEQRVNAMLDIWNLEGVEAVRTAGDSRPDAHLLGGPRSDGIDQTGVDALLAGAVPAPTAEAAPAPVTPAEPSRQGRPVPLDQSAIDNLFD